MPSYQHDYIDERSYLMGLKIYINGKFYPESRAKVSVFDHGYLYGDGVFETLRSEGGEVFKLDEHLNRLFNSAQTIKLRVPLTKEEIKEAVKETLKKNRLKSAYIRVSLSRGRGELGLSPKSCSSPNLVIIAKGPKGYPLKLYQKGVEVITVSTRRSDPAMLFPNIKCANFLWGILAKIEAEQRDAFEAILLNSKGEVTEGTVSNIFIVKESILITPPTYVGILEGITRNCVIELAKKIGIEVKEEIITCYDLYTADESFLTNTSLGIMPVVKVDGRVIGKGKPGKITRRLIVN